MKPPRRLLVTGASGLIGSEVCAHFHALGWHLHGVDNNQRAVFFGEAGDTRWNQQRLQRELKAYDHHEIDIRDRAGIRDLLANVRPSAIVHTAAQPSHDRAAQIPFEDFDTNAGGTFNLLEGARRHCPEAPFVHLSTNKVYGDAPNRLKLVERPKRWDYVEEEFFHGIPETFPVDQSTHSLFGASKLAADIAVQEYGRYFGMPTCCLRGGCLTGPHHSGVQLHGFLSFLVATNLSGREYTVFGYQGKQVRDNLHASDVAGFIAAFIDGPRSGEVYNLGGGRENSCSILEAFEIVEAATGQPMRHRYNPAARRGDHICYISDLRKVRAHYPEWQIHHSLEATIGQIAEALAQRIRP
ncbi:MAG: NAD-dependent epimerase/dehydratase family protein [Opitutales bacterium]